MLTTDEETVAALHKAAAYTDKPMPPRLDGAVFAVVVEDESGEIIVGASARLVPDIDMAMKRNIHPLVKREALDELHRYFRAELLKAGFCEASCSVPPELEHNYGRLLKRRYGWQEKWTSYVMREEGHV